MSTLAQRSIFLKLIDQACRAGARLHSACHLIGLAARTVQRWRSRLAQAARTAHQALAASGEPKLRAVAQAVGSRNRVLPGSNGSSRG